MLTPDKRIEIIEMITNGLTSTDISLECDVNPDVVRRIAREEGLQLTRPHKPKLEDILEVDVESLIRDYNAGVDMGRIREKYGLPTVQSIHAILQRHGVESRKWSSEAVIARQTAIERALEMYQENLPGWLITQETGVDSTTLLNELHKRGIPLKRERARAARGVAMIPPDEYLKVLTDEEKEFLAVLQEKLLAEKKRQAEALAREQTKAVRPGRRS